MVPILASLVKILADKGLNLISSAIDGGADKAKEFIEEKTGISLDKPDKLSSEDITRLKELEISYETELKQLALENKKEDNPAHKYSSFCISARNFPAFAGDSTPPASDSQAAIAHRAARQSTPADRHPPRGAQIRQTWPIRCRGWRRSPSTLQPHWRPRSGSASP